VLSCFLLFSLEIFFLGAEGQIKALQGALNTRLDHDEQNNLLTGMFCNKVITRFLRSNR